LGSIVQCYRANYRINEKTANEEETLI